MLLLDTGARRTCIAAHVAQKLGLKTLGKVPSYGASGLHENDSVYAQLKLALPDQAGAPASLLWDALYMTIPDLESHPPGLSLDGRSVELVGLLGRDILRHATVVYDGEAGKVELDFDPNWLAGTPSP